MAIMSTAENEKYKAYYNDRYTLEAFIDETNDRVKLINYQGEIQLLAKHLITLAKEYSMGKIICNVFEEHLEDFLKLNYVLEGTIEGYFKGKIAFCVSYFVKTERSISENKEEKEIIIEKSLQAKRSYECQNISGFIFRVATPEDASELAQLYDTVFDTYPTPMENSEYIKKGITDNIYFRIAEHNGRIVSAASADINRKFANAEITDCATLPEYRGKGLLSHLIYHLEIEIQQRSIITLYSLCRSLSPGMNVVLSKHGYDYTGRMINNCHIMGHFEDMNIWVKML